jgi:hypothetical protein
MSGISATIETLEHRWMRAWIAGDRRDLRRLTSRRFRLVIGCNPCAVLDSKSWLEATKDRLRCSSYSFGDVFVQDLGAQAIFATQLTQRATINGEDWSGQFWMSNVWRKGGLRRNWRLVARIVSRPDESPDIPAAIGSLQLWRSDRISAPNAVPDQHRRVLRAEGLG